MDAGPSQPKGSKGSGPKGPSSKTPGGTDDAGTGSTGSYLAASSLMRDTVLLLSKGGALLGVRSNLRVPFAAWLAQVGVLRMPLHVLPCM